MITQQAISARIDYDVLKALDQEAFVSCHKRNRIIHDSLIMYIQWADMCRRIDAGSAPNIEINDYYQSFRRVAGSSDKLYFTLRV